VECSLLQSQLAALRAALRPGFSPLNWNSLHIGAFCGEVNRALQDFVSLLTQVRKSCAVLEEVVAAIEGTSLVDAKLFEGASGLAYAEVYDTLEKFRSDELRRPRPPAVGAQTTSPGRAPTPPRWLQTVRCARILCAMSAATLSSLFRASPLRWTRRAPASTL
jgi:hypothetical protein